jgi:hypothetical protein
MDEQIEAFVATWMHDNRHVLEEIVLTQCDDPSTPLGAAMAAYLNRAEPWAPRLEPRPERR